MSEEQIDWAAVRADYEAGDKNVLDLLAEHKAPRRGLYDRIKDEGWIRRSAVRPSTRPGLIGRMYRLLERQILRLELEMDDVGDKEAAILGNLTRNLEKLIDLDRKDRGSESQPVKRTDIAVLRKKLADRLEKLRKS